MRLYIGMRLFVSFVAFMFNSVVSLGPCDFSFFSCISLKFVVEMSCVANSLMLRGLCI